MLQNFLGRRRPESEAQRRFQAWPPAPPVQPSGWGKPLPALVQPKPRQPTQYTPAMVIGLGAAGDQVLRQWLGQVASTSVGQPVLLRAASFITRATADPMPAGPVPVRQFLLDPFSTARIGSFNNRRQAARAHFREYVHYTAFRDWARHFVAEHRQNIQVVVVASIAEPEIGMVGEVLQTLRQSAEGAVNPFLRIVALLTSETPEPARALDPAETYAAMREIARFAVNGPHWMEPPPGAPSGIVHSSLLDHLFLVEARGPTPNALDLSGTPFDQGVGQALAEALFTFLHPSANQHLDMWDNLRTDEPLVHSLGIAVLRVPVAEMQAYVAARLAHAAMYGEHPYLLEGLVFRGQARVAPDAEDDSLSRHWLKNGPWAHPLFHWLLDEVNGPNSFRVVPSLTPGFEVTFQAQMAHGLIALLNTASDVDVLGRSRAALNRLAKLIGQLDGWLKAVPDSTPGVSERMTLRDLFGRWQETVAYLKQQINAWESALFEPEQPSAPVHANAASLSTGSSLADWRTPDAAPADAASGGLSADWSPSTPAISAAWSAPAVLPSSIPSPPSAASASKTLPEYLRQYRRAAEAALIAAAGGRISRALTADQASELTHAEAYYADTVRPELKQLGLGHSQAFGRVRERLGWWISLSPGSQPILFLICLPPELAVESSESPPPAARFTSHEIERLGQSLLSVARTQAQGLAAHLTGPWFQQRLKKMADFLGRAAHPLLNYDQNAAAARPHHASHAYLIARDHTLTGPYRGAAFPDTPSFEIHEIADGEETRVTALNLRYNIPLTTVVSLREAYRSYRHRTDLHLYPQERTAALYETHGRVQNNEWAELPPDFVPALADPRLVTLFYQSLIGGLIELRLDNLGQTRYWTLLPPDPAYTPLPLAAEGPSDLWQALRHFALELPNDRAVDQNLANPFHRVRRAKFLETLTAAVRERQRQPDFKSRREDVRNTLLAEWRQRGERDHLARAFARLLAIELEGPAWPEW